MSEQHSSYAQTTFSFLSDDDCGYFHIWVIMNTVAVNDTKAFFFFFFSFAVHAACRIFIPPPGLELTTLHWECSFNH